MLLQICLSILRLHESLVAQLKQIIQHEVSTAVRQQQSSLTSRLEQALRSGAATPVPMEHRIDAEQMKQQIASLLRQGKMNTAFQQVVWCARLSLHITEIAGSAIAENCKKRPWFLADNKYAVCWWRWDTIFVESTILHAQDNA